jgi:serine/threonine protein kinase
LNNISRLLQCPDRDFVRLLAAMLRLDPHHRITPLQALRHPFISHLFPFGIIFPEPETMLSEDSSSETVGLVFPRDSKIRRIEGRNGEWPSRANSSLSSSSKANQLPACDSGRCLRQLKRKVHRVTTRESSEVPYCPIVAKHSEPNRFGECGSLEVRSRRDELPEVNSLTPDSLKDSKRQKTELTRPPMSPFRRQQIDDVDNDEICSQ